MIEFLDSIDKELLVFLNGFHNPFMDEWMWRISSTSFWIPFYVLLLFVLVRKKWTSIGVQNVKQIGFVIISISVAILLADQISSGFFKPFFARLRPSHSPDLTGLVHLLTDSEGNIYKGGTYGFVSSHAANSFAVAWFSATLINSRVAWFLMLLWATLVSYSRIYLGVHYPGDIIAGMLVGLFSGYIATKVYFYLENKWVS